MQVFAPIFRVTPLFLLALLCATMAKGQEIDRRAQVAAAKADALQSLQTEILSAAITPEITLKDLLDRIGAADEFSNSLGKARQVGGTRWLDDDTCQVRVEMDGKQVARTVLRLVEAEPKKSPLSIDTIHNRLSAWHQRSFTATGKSTGPGAVESLRPRGAHPAWNSVGDDERRQAIAKARLNAGQRVLESIGPVELSDGKTVEDALKDNAVRDPLEQWLSRRPVTSVEFREDLEIQLTEAVPPVELSDVLRDALEHQHGATVPADEAGWSKVRSEIVRRVGTPVGRAKVLSGRGNVTRTIVVLPKDPPVWADQQIDATGIAHGQRKSLLVTQDARDIALKRLREQIHALPLTKDLNIGQAAKTDADINDAVEDAVQHRSHVYKVRYLDDGNVETRLSLDLSDLWAELQRH